MDQESQDPCVDSLNEGHGWLSAWQQRGARSLEDELARRSSRRMGVHGGGASKKKKSSSRRRRSEGED